jgi:tetratricopeptide (TPR) repeat protein
MNAKHSQGGIYLGTNARGRSRSRHLELYTRSIFGGLKKKYPELLPPAAADCTWGIRLMETRSRNEDDKLSTEPGQLQSSFYTSLDLNPNGPNLHWNIALTLMLQGKYPEALDEMQRETAAPARAVGFALIYGAMGRALEAEEALRDMTEIRAKVSPFWFAVVYASRGEKDQAFGSLDRAYEGHDFYLIDMRGFRLLKNLESDPRYDAFLRKMNFPL